jgi:hypothetical protein
MNPRYTALPLLALVLKVLSFLLLLAGLGYVLKYLVFGSSAKALLVASGHSTLAVALKAHVLPALWAGTKAVFGFLGLFTAAELIHVILDIEENTRRAADTIAGGGTGFTPRR